MIKILVVDDEPAITKLVSAYLKPEGYEVYTATDDNAGLKAACTFKPDLLILELMLPGIDGIELLSRLRRESDVHLIMLTARNDDTERSMVAKSERSQRAIGEQVPFSLKISK